MKAKIPNALLSVAYRFSLLKSRPQLYRSYTEFASLPRRPTVLGITCLVHLRHTSPSDTRASSSQLPTTPFPDSFTVADNPGTVRVRLKKSDRGWIKLKWRAIEMHPVQQVTITLVGAERFKIRLSVHSSKVRITLGQSRLEKLEHLVRLSEGSVVDGKTDW
jgi:hypothetical protein